MDSRMKEFTGRVCDYCDQKEPFQKLYIKEWTAHNRTFRLGDRVVYRGNRNNGGIVTFIGVREDGIEGYVILDDNPKTRTDFYFLELDLEYNRDIKLKQLGI